MGDSQFNGTQEEWDALIKKNKSKTMTAVDFIKEELERLGLLDKGEVMTNIFEQAKQMEKEQLNIARIDGINLANKGYEKE